MPVFSLVYMSFHFEVFCGPNMKISPDHFVRKFIELSNRKYKCRLLLRWCFANYVLSSFIVSGIHRIPKCTFFHFFSNEETKGNRHTQWVWYCCVWIMHWIRYRLNSMCYLVLSFHIQCFKLGCCNTFACVCLPLLFCCYCCFTCFIFFFYVSLLWLVVLSGCTCASVCDCITSISNVWRFFNAFTS